ncbi:hypothetical protein FHS21_004667 [Phyllobacterium trifolii]|uniref:Integrase n=1 Tax=Phyllobacterium trifolii TaxID=300193 RepID=A0A839UEE4_9HYPH|nr:VPA1269 family protein [Phyllobacterium trifolii]MBB3148224.1 hypothetical protein [Phyllobacterium trifolii]
MSLMHFTGREDTITGPSAALIVQNSKLGRDLEAKLSEWGVPEKIYGRMVPDNQQGYQRYLTLIISGLCMASTGADSLDDLGSETVRAFFGFYYDSARQKFRTEEIWGKRGNIAGKCLRKLATAFGTYFGDPQIIAMGRASRSAVPGSVNSADLINNIPRHLTAWMEGWNDWRGTVRATTTGAVAALQKLAAYLNHLNETGTDVSSPEFFLQRQHKPSLIEFLNERRSSRGLDAISLSVVADLSKIRQFSNHMAELLQLKVLGKPYYDLIPERQRLKLVNDLRRSGKGQPLGSAASKALPMRYYRLLQEILEEGADGWPGKHPYCQALIAGQRRYVPVLPTLFLLPYEIPERIAQFVRLDSGEGDPELFNPTTEKWEENTGPLAGYWSTSDPADPYRGCIRRTNDPRVAGLWINTNKTGKPFLVPWHNRRIHKLVTDLRIWQQTWNPTNRAITGKEYVDGANKADEGGLDSYPDIIPLMRIPDIGIPKATMRNRFWLDALFEVQNRWNETCEPEDVDHFVGLDQYGRPKKSKYGAHGMRVAGITLLIQAGVPLEVVSEFIAGHKSLLMTIYYHQLSPAQITRSLDEGAMKLVATMTSAALTEFKTLSFEQVKRRTVSTHPDALKNAMPENGGDRILWTNRALGICPWEGTRCHDGGVCIRREVKNGRDNSTYGPVEGGPDSCVLCRHFLTGPEWEDPLVGYGSLLSRRLTITSREINDAVDESHEIRVRLLTTQKGSSDFEKLKWELKECTQLINDFNAKQSLLAKCMIETKNLLTQISTMVREGMAEDEDGRKSLISQADNTVVEWLHVSEFEQVAFVQKYGRVYRGYRDKESLDTCRRMIDEVAIKSRFQPISAGRRTAAETVRAYEAAAQYLLENVSREDLHAMSHNALSLDDLGLQSDEAKKFFMAPFDPQFLKLPTSISSLREIA